MTSECPILELKGVTRVFSDPRGPVRVLSGVELKVRPGDFVVITGPSGSGKTTLLNIAALLDRPTDGSARFRGRDIAGLADGELCRIRATEIGMVFQKFHLLQHRTVLENVLFRWRYVDSGAVDIRAEAERALRQVGLDAIAHRQARLLSAGEMQRTAIARATALPPRLLLADEPTGNLDGESASSVMQCFRTLNAGGMTIMMVTHNEHLLAHGARHLVCRGGRLVVP